MKKKHFIQIALILNKGLNRIKIGDTQELSRFTTLIFSLIEYLKRTNYKFSSEAFLDIVYKGH